MANIIELGGLKDVIGCTDPAASNFNPLATISCGPTGPTATPDLGGVYTNGCCTYGSVSVVGCMDPQANNFNPVASTPCNTCCDYGVNTGDIGLDLGDLVWNPNGAGDPISCDQQIFEVSSSGLLLADGNPVTEECCSYYASLGYITNWNPIHKQCIVETPPENNDTFCESLILGDITELELKERVTCIDCDNFAWWDNLYTTINGDSLQNINTPLWDFLVSVITSDPTDPLSPNFGNGSFYVDTLTGEPIIDEECCAAILDSNFVTNTNEYGEESSACLCDTTPETIIECECLTDVGVFLSIASTIEGAELLLTPTTLLSLGLSSDEAIFIINNAFNDSDIDNDNILESAKVRILVSNALAVSGGFYLCYETTASTPNEPIPNEPIPTSGTTHGRRRMPNQGTTQTPMLVSSTKCEELGGFFDGTLCYCEPQDVCDVSLTGITMTTIVDDFNQNLTVVTFNGESISETCCLQIASDNNLPWSYENYNGEVNCFTSDPNPCLPLEFKLNRDLIKPECETPIDVSMSFYFGKPEDPCVPFEEDDEIIIIDNPTEPCILEFDEDNNLIDYNTTTTRRRLPQEAPQLPPISGDTEPPCCYNPEVPISVNLVIRDDKDNVIQTSESFSFIDVETWFDLTTQFTIPTTGTTEGFNAYLQFTSGLNCCCVYDIFLDNFNFNCNEELTITEIINNDCPGFDIAPVIDNKKSWVYNPGEYGYSEYQNQNGRFTDNRIISQGQYGLIQGYGEINRTFAPSLDADLEWRYTDYFKQSSVLEKHSNLVLNSKELFLTFDMCMIGGPCPEGYTLSANTDTCYQTTLGCPENYILSGGTCYCDGILDEDCWEVFISPHIKPFIPATWQYTGCTDNTTKYITLGTTSTGETVCIQSGTTAVCLSGDCGTSTISAPCSVCTNCCPTSATTPTSMVVTEKSNPLACRTKFTLLELEGYKKTFQSFWVQFVEQFIPATTIFVSGEKWCNRPDEICTQYDECDFDFEFVEGDVTTIPNGAGLIPPIVTSGRSQSYVPNNGNNRNSTTFNPLDYESTEDGPINRETVKINPLPKEDGETTITPSSVGDLGNRKKRKLLYQNRLQTTQTIIE